MKPVVHVFIWYCQFPSVLLVKSFPQAFLGMLLAVSVLDLLHTETAHRAFGLKSKWIILLNLFCSCQAENPDVFWGMA